MSDSFPFELTDQCVRCGLCLPHCPTYRLDRNEAEGPRGRIVIMEAIAKGQIPATTGAQEHLSHCLGCARCEQVCPAKVPYLQIRDSYRARTLSPIRRLLLWALSQGQTAFAQCVLSALAVFARYVPMFVLPARLNTARQLLLSRPHGKAPQPRAAPGVAPGAQAPPELFRGCVASGLDPRAFNAAAELLAQLESPVYPSLVAQCCGALAQHAGALSQAENQRNALARDSSPLVALDSGCIADLRRSGRSVTEVCRYLLQHWPEHWHPQAAKTRVALHLPCTHQNGCGDSSAVRELLARIPDLECIEIRGLGCCGAGGTHMLDHPARAADFARTLLAEIPAGVSVLVSTNMGCRSHLRTIAPQVQIHHPLELLRTSLAQPD